MKKHISVAALTLRLTWVLALGLFAAVGVLQWLLTPGAGIADSYQDLLRNAVRVGKIGFLVLIFLLMFSLDNSRRSVPNYTWRRLRIREGWATVISGLVITGWLILYWGFQLGMCLGLYRKYIEVWGFGQEYLMLSALRAEYLHLLLPLEEPWAVIRNCVFVLVLGNFLAQSARMARKGKNIRPRFLLFYLGSHLPQSQSIATQSDDILCMIFWFFFIVGLWHHDWRWMKHEAP